MNTPKCFFRGVLEALGCVPVTVPENTTWILTSVLATNISTEDAYVTVSIDEGEEIDILHGALVPTGGTISLDCAQVIESAGVIRGHSQVSDTVALHVSGVEIT